MEEILSKTYSILGRTFLISCSADWASIFLSYIRYAATIVVLRPEQGLRFQRFKELNVYDALIPARQCTSTPRPLSSSAWMKRIDGKRCVRTSASSLSSNMIWWRINVFQKSFFNDLKWVKERFSRTSCIETFPRIAVRMLKIPCALSFSTSCALDKFPIHKPGTTSSIRVEAENGGHWVSASRSRSRLFNTQRLGYYYLSL